jgi:hypothetical protein
VVQEEALSLAERHGRPFTLAQARTFRATVLALEESWAEAGRLAARTLEIADDYGFPLWRGAALVIHGRVLVESEGGPGGLAEISEGLAVLRANGLRLGLPVRLGFLAGACLRVGEWERGLAAVDAGLTQCHETDARFFEAELWRLRGELILAQGPVGGSTRSMTVRQAEECFDRAQALAKAQGARMLARRAGQRAPGAAPRRAFRRNFRVL